MNLITVLYSFKITVGAGRQIIQPVPFMELVRHIYLIFSFIFKLKTIAFVVVTELKQPLKYFCGIIRIGDLRGGAFSKYGNYIG